METRTVKSNGREIKYGLDGDEVVVFHPDTGEEVVRVSYSDKEKPPVIKGGYPGRSPDDFMKCMKGCWNPAHGSNWEWAQCIALCSTIIIGG